MGGGFAPWVCCLLWSRWDSKNFQREEGRPHPGRARRAVFLSRWPIHKTPPLSFRLALATARFSPPQGFISLRGGGGILSAEKALRAWFSRLYRVAPSRLVVIDGLALWAAGSAGSQHLPWVPGQLQDWHTRCPSPGSGTLSRGACHRGSSHGGPGQWAPGGGQIRLARFIWTFPSAQFRPLAQGLILSLGADRWSLRVRLSVCFLQGRAAPTLLLPAPHVCSPWPHTCSPLLLFASLSCNLCLWFSLSVVA